MDRVSLVLPQVLSKRGLRTAAHASQVLVRAQQWLDERLPLLYGAVRASTLKDGALLLACEHSVAAQECQSVASVLQDVLNKEFGGSLVREIRTQRL